MQPTNTYPILVSLLIIPVFLYILNQIRARGFSEGWWLPWMSVLLLFPCYVWSGWGSLRMDLRSAASLAVLTGFLIQPWSSGPRIRWIWGDAWIIILIASQAITEFSQENLVPLTPLEQLRDFGLPYLVGRLCLRSPGDLQRMLPAVCIPAAILSVYAIIESITKINVVNLIIGKRWELLETSEGFRWGLKRAQGNLNHPIYLGLMLTMLLPWLLEAYSQSKKNLGAYWWRFSPALAIVAIIGTVSRAAQLAAVLTLTTAFIFRNPRWRGILIGMVLVAGGTGYLFREDILEALSKFVDEPDKSSDVIKHKGLEYPYSGTLHRDLLQMVYEDEVKNVPLLGYGSMLESMPVDNDRDERFKSIDDHYLVYLLRFGPVGVTIFLCFAVCIAIYLFREAWANDTPHAAFCGAMLGSFVGTTMMLKGVSLEPDYGWMWLFSAGIAGRLHAFRLELHESKVRSDSPGA
jgi:hypothetical protein